MFRFSECLCCGVVVRVSPVFFVCSRNLLYGVPRIVVIQPGTLRMSRCSERRVNRSGIGSSIIPISWPNYTTLWRTPSGANSAGHPRPFWTRSCLNSGELPIAVLVFPMSVQSCFDCQLPYWSFRWRFNVESIASCATGLSKCRRFLISILVCLVYSYLLVSKGGSWAVRGDQSHTRVVYCLLVL